MPMPQEERSQGSLYMLFGVLFTIIALVALVSLVIIRSRAAVSGPVAQSGSITNVAPTVDTAKVAIASAGAHETGVTLNEGTASADGSTTLYVNGIISDLNGCEDVSQIDIVFYRSGVAGGTACTANDSNCYTATMPSGWTGCTSGTGDTDLTYEKTLSILHFADATDAGSPYPLEAWKVYVIATDSGQSTGSLTSADTDIATTIGLDITSSVSYGTLALGADSAEKTTVVTTVGNASDTNVNLKVNADMTCTRGTIPAGNVHVSTTTPFAYAAGTALSTTNQLFDTVLPRQTTAGSRNTANIYWMLRIPSSGVGGSCSNTATATAVQG